MIKRIAILFAITGAGYGFSVLVLKYLAKYGQVAQVAGIAEVDSLIQFLIGLIGFGMQTDAIRSISFADDWKDQLAKAQQARITLSCLLMPVALLSFHNQYFIYFLLAPVIAFSSDYALYARGFPLVGSWVAFLRVAAPLLSTLLAALFFPNHVLVTYCIATALVYILTNAIIAWHLKTPFYYLPNLGSLKLYLNTLPLGVINLCFYFFGLGLLLVAQFFFDERELIISFVALKFYLIYKGAIRVIQQAFVNRMKEEAVCLSIDRISIMMSVLFVGSIAIFPTTFIGIFFGDQFNNEYLFFVFLGCSAVSFSVWSSVNTRALLERQDQTFMKIALSAVIITLIVFFVMIQFTHTSKIITLSLFVGETFFAVALAIRFLTLNQIVLRLQFLLVCVMGLALPWVAKMWKSDQVFIYLTSFGLLGILMLILLRKKLILPQTVNL